MLIKNINKSQYTNLQIFRYYKMLKMFKNKVSG